MGPDEAFNSPKDLIDYDEIMTVDFKPKDPKKPMKIKNLEFNTAGEEADECTDLSGTWIEEGSNKMVGIESVGCFFSTTEDPENGGGEVLPGEEPEKVIMKPSGQECTLEKKPKKPMQIKCKDPDKTLTL